MYESIVKLGVGVAIPKSSTVAGLDKRARLESEICSLATEEIRFEFPLEWEDRYRDKYDGVGVYVCVKVSEPSPQQRFVHVSILNCASLCLELPLRLSQIATLELHALERCVEILRSTPEKA